MEGTEEYSEQSTVPQEQPLPSNQSPDQTQDRIAWKALVSVFCLGTFQRKPRSNSPTRQITACTVHLMHSANRTAVDGM